MKTQQKRIIQTLYAAPLLLLSGLAGADVIEWNTTTTSGDWFDPNNWNPMVVPVGFGGGTAGDDAFINNAGTANANSATAPGDVRTRSLSVGAGGSAAGASGTFISNGVRVEAAFGASVGVASADTTTATGTVTVNGASLDTGSNVSVGGVFSANAPAAGTGSLSVDGDLDAASFNVGQISINTADPTFSREATAIGEAIVGGTVTASVSVGVNTGGDINSVANGTLTVTSGDLNVGAFGLNVGRTSGAFGADAGSATGVLRIEAGAITPTSTSGLNSIEVGRAFTTTGGGVAIGTLETAALDMAGGNFRDFGIGRAAGPSAATGIFSSAGGDLVVSRDVGVGVAQNGQGPTATGSADFGNGSIIGLDGLAREFAVGVVTSNLLLNNPGEGTGVGIVEANGVAGFNNYYVGVVRGTVQASTIAADGTLTVGTSGIQGNADEDSLLFVGSVIGSPNNGMQIGPGGSARGSATVNGDIGGFRQINIGSNSAVTIGSGMGQADGTLTLAGGSVTTQTLNVGFAQHTNTSQAQALEVEPVATGRFDMDGGTLRIEAPAFGSLTNTATWNVGSAISTSSTSLPDPEIPVDATGTVTLSNVDVVGNVNVAIGRTIGFGDGVNTATGAVTAVGGSMDIGSLTIGGSFGSKNIARGVLTLTDSRLLVSDNVTVAGGGDARGELLTANTNISIGGDLSVAGFRGAIGTDTVPETRGIMTMSNAALDVGGSVIVGAQYGGGNGDLVLDNVTADVDGRLQLGNSSNTGSLFGFGTIALTSSTLNVGLSSELDSGLFSLTDSSADFGGFLTTEFFNQTTGEYFTNGTADAEIRLRRSDLTVAESFGFGVGDLLSITLDGATRGSEYGAVDAATVDLLGGILDVGIAFALTADSYMFDLIVSSAFDGISGEFDVFNLAGLTTGYSYTAGVVLDDLGAGAVEIYRLTLTRSVDEPATIYLMLLALALLLGRQHALLRNARQCS